ncbi:hypothetical protein CBM2605_A260195 [Cupriavidus neocaledonicus]|uniref:Uncharacterized protein n=1 Tax=Cupriavidus neocaledonicus TaxID=1040979 RepID=A0ABY1V1D5_9BURK|nr:hypothetical protein CBM2605_A260195 [Cupriavidus neocaledonicus]
MRRGARPVHQPRPGWRARRQRLRDQRCDGGDPGAPGAGAGRGGGRHRRPVRHDGRPHRRGAHRAGRQRPHPYPHHGVLGQVRVGILRPVPRRGGLGRQPGQGQQDDLPDGPGQHRRGPARSGAGHPGRRRHGDGQARHAVPGHRASGQGRIPLPDLRVPGQRRVRDAQGRRAERLAGPRQGHDGIAAGLPPRRRRRHPDLLCARCRAAAAGLTADGPRMELLGFSASQVHPLASLTEAGSFLSGNAASLFCSCGRIFPLKRSPRRPMTGASRCASWPARPSSTCTWPTPPTPRIRRTSIRPMRTTW